MDGPLSVMQERLERFVEFLLFSVSPHPTLTHQVRFPAGARAVCSPCAGAGAVRDPRPTEVREDASRPTGPCEERASGGPSPRSAAGPTSVDSSRLSPQRGRPGRGSPCTSKLPFASGVIFCSPGFRTPAPVPTFCYD